MRASTSGNSATADGGRVTSFRRYNPWYAPPKPTPHAAFKLIRAVDSDEHIYKLKIDGFRELAYIEAGKGELISRNVNTFRGFADLATWIAEHLRVESVVLDGEIACVDGARQCFVTCCSGVG